MSQQTFGRIAALEYLNPPGMAFSEIVEEFDIATQGLPAQLRRLTWDGEDIALIDRETIRIALGWLPPEHQGAAHYLVIALGSSGRRHNKAFDPDACERLLRRLVERVRDYLPFDTELHGPAHRPIGSDLIDMTFDLLTRCPTRRTDDAAPRAGHALRHRPTDHRDVPEPQNARHATYPRHYSARKASILPPPASFPMRLTIVTFGLVLFLHAPPIGAGLLTYTTLREAQPLFS